MPGMRIFIPSNLIRNGRINRYGHETVIITVLQGQEAEERFSYNEVQVLVET